MRKRPFYGYVIVTAAMLVMVSVYGVVNNCYAFYLAPVTQELGLSRESYSFAQSLMFIALMLTAPFAGAVYRRFDLMKVMRVCVCALVASYISYGFCQKLWQFYVLAAVIGSAQCFITTIPLAIIIRNWFKRSYGLALGLAFMGSGIGGMVFSPVISGIIGTLGWRYSFFIVGGIMAVVNFAAVFLMLRVKPSDMGLEPLCDPNAPETREQPDTGGTMRATLRMPSFYLMLLFSVLNAVASYGVSTYIAPYYEELGHSAAFITFCASASMGGMAVGKVLFGKIIDRFGLKTATFCGMGAMTLGFVGMVFSQNAWMFILVFIGVAIGCPFGTIAPAVIVKDMFGTRDFGTKLGFYSAVGNLGSAICPYFGGAVYDATGGYRSAVIILLAVSAALMLGYMLVIPGRNSKRRITS